MRPKLSKATQIKLANILLQLATTAQYSKVIHSGCWNRPLAGKLAHLWSSYSAYACNLVYCHFPYTRHVCKVLEPTQHSLQKLGTPAEVNIYSGAIIGPGSQLMSCICRSGRWLGRPAM